MPMPRSRAQPRRLKPGAAASTALHLLLLAAIMLMRPAGTPEEEPSAPSFAIEFTAGEGAPQSSQAPASQPEVSLGIPSIVQPPPDENAEPLPQPIRRPQYGQAQQHRANNNPFAHVVPFDLSPRQPRSLSAGLPGSHSLDLAAGPVVQNGRLTDAVTHTMGNHGYGDYLEQLSDFIEAHKYYPHSAQENGEEGSATVQVTITRDGHVKNLRLVSSSGSHVLDAAWMAIFRDNQLPPFNDDIPGNEQTWTLTLNYELIRQNAPGGFQWR
jgi:protein TonB